jgi:hypothetical protein
LRGRNAMRCADFLRSARRVFPPLGDGRPSFWGR